MRLLAALLLPLLLVAAPPAAAQPVPAPDAAVAPAGEARVEALAHVDPAGRWRQVDRTDQASILRAAGGPEELVTVGSRLGPGDRVQTRAARVTLRLHDGSTLRLSEDADLTLLTADADRWSRLRQEAGAVWYRMRSALTVEHGTVETVVEGTRFLVATPPPPAPVAVRVEQGRVRVQRGDGAAVALRAFRQAELPAEGPAPAPRAWRPRPSELAWTWPLGRPRLTLDTLVAVPIALDGGPPGAGLRLSAGLHLPARLRLVGEAGLGLEAGDTHVPTALGLSWAAGPVVLGALGTAELERCTYDCGSEALLLHLGGMGFARAQRQLLRRAWLSAELRGGWAGAWRVEPGLGLGVGL